MKFEELINKLDSEPLTKVIPIALRVAQTTNNSDFEKWLKLELNGYFNTNPAMTDEIEVPEYRTITGQHYDDMGRRLEVGQSNLNFVNTTRLRYSTVELENMIEKGGNFSIRDPFMCEMIKDNLGAEVTQFSFHSAQIASILTAIKTELSDRLMALRNEIGSSSVSINDSDIREDIIELKPNFFGLGINLNALARKWKSMFKKK